MSGGAGRGGGPPLTDAQRLLITSALTMADRVARHVARRTSGADLRELRAVGYEALTQAARTYDPAKNASFEGFAWRRVYGAVRDAAAALPAFSPAGVAALDAAEEMRDDTGAFSGGEAEFARHVAESCDDLAAGFTLGCASGVIQRLGEEGFILLEERVRGTAALRTALAALPGDDRRLLHLRFVEQRPVRDAAAALGVSKSTFDRRYRALRAHLREALAAEGICAVPGL